MKRLIRTSTAKSSIKSNSEVVFESKNYDKGREIVNRFKLRYPKAYEVLGK